MSYDWVETAISTVAGVFSQARKLLRPVLIGAALFLCYPSTGGAQGTTPVSISANPSAPAAVNTIEISQGTPVLVHFFGNRGYLDYSPTDDRLNAIVLQVDNDVVINGIVVIRQGSLGLAHTDGRAFNRHGGDDTYNVRLLWVFSIESVQLNLDSSTITATFTADPASKSQHYTAKLLHAIVPLSK